MAAVAVVGGVGELTPQPAVAAAKHECTLLNTATAGCIPSILNS